MLGKSRRAASALTSLPQATPASVSPGVARMARA